MQIVVADHDQLPSSPATGARCHDDAHRDADWTDDAKGEFPSPPFARVTESCGSLTRMARSVIEGKLKCQAKTTYCIRSSRPILTLSGMLKWHVGYDMVPSEGELTSCPT
jgi:hypothetical protein